MNEPWNQPLKLVCELDTEVHYQKDHGTFLWEKTKTELVIINASF